MSGLSSERLAEILSRYGTETSGPNWQAEDYADGPFKDDLLNRAKADVRDLLSEVNRMRGPQ